MIRELPGIDQPKDTAILRKYMSFEKFVNLLSTKSLFFTRSDKFDDPFEGFTPPSVTEQYKRTVSDGNTLVELQKYLPKCAFCSCWHLAEEDEASIAMWEKYHMHNSGIAIKTTFGDFKKCLEEKDKIFVGNIKYINHHTYPIPQNINEKSSLYTWFFHKRKPFEYEKEFRAILFHIPFELIDYIDSTGNFIQRELKLNNINIPDTLETGKYLRVNVNKLIREVITSPYLKGEKWITDTVESVVQQYGFNFDVKPSTLLDHPYMHSLVGGVSNPD